MKIKKSTLDSVVYIIACIFTGGVIWISRVVISVAIRKAITSPKE